MLRTMSLIFLYVNTHIINKIILLLVDLLRRKSYGVLSSTR
jgi:hypothetical protein